MRKIQFTIDHYGAPKPILTPEELEHISKIDKCVLLACKRAGNEVKRHHYSSENTFKCAWNNSYLQHMEILTAKFRKKFAPKKPFLN